jgi:hypothetical protein
VELEHFSSSNIFSKLKDRPDIFTTPVSAGNGSCGLLASPVNTGRNELGECMFKIVRYDRVPAKQTLQATFLEHKEAVLSIARTAISFSQHGRHIEYVKGGIDIIDAYDKTTVAFRIETG